jgi:hypothetical protein
LELNWNVLSIVIPWNLNGIPMEIVPGSFQIPTISTGFHCIPLEFPWNWKPKWLRLQPTGFRWNSDIPLRIHRNSWGSVKTSLESEPDSAPQPVKSPKPKTCCKQIQSNTDQVASKHKKEGEHDNNNNTTDNESNASGNNTTGGDDMPAEKGRVGQGSG